MITKVMLFQFLVSTQALDLDSSTSDSWRCGIFIPGQNWRTPLAKFFVLQSIHKADCPAKFRDSKINGRFAKICGKLVRYIELTISSIYIMYTECSVELQVCHSHSVPFLDNFQSFNEVFISKM